MFRQIVVLNRVVAAAFSLTHTGVKNVCFKKIPSNFVYQIHRKYSTKMATDAKQLKSEADLTIGTHDGIFHCDEILACFMLQSLPKYANAAIVRTRNDELLNTCDIVVDVGSVFDPERLRFDHHQKTFQHTLSTLKPEYGDKWTVRLSSAGLIYTYYGEDVIRQVIADAGHGKVSDECLRNVFLKVYEYFIQEIDGIDNGVPQHPDEPLYRITTNLSSRVGNFNSVWNSKEDYDVAAQFERAKQLVGAELTDRILYYATVWWPARSIVDEAIQKRLEVHSSGEILELSQMCPWKQHLYDLEKKYGIEGVLKYCIAESSPNDYRVICVSLSANSYICRKFLPKEWRGIRDNELKEVAGINDAKFCHATGFIGGAASRNGALAMAIKGVEAPPEEN